MTVLQRAFLLAIVVVVFITAWPLWVNADFYFVHPSLQILDFASNDMLVSEAKNLSLLHGHYSRAGFYHPGPFYLYWMAGWETLFVDVWPVFSSAAAAQHFSATLLMALSFGCFSFLTQRLCGNTLTATAATAAMFTLIYVTAGNTITAPWTPHMLVASSLFTLSGCIGLLAFGWRWFALLLFGALQLLHGHASFFGLLPILLLPTIMAAMRLHAWPRGLSGVITACICAAVTLIMLAPLMVITVFNFPQPWLSYLQQAGSSNHLAVEPALQMVASFAAILLLATPLLLPNRLFERRLSPTQAVVLSRLRLIAFIVGGSAVIAAAFFALRGVDDSNNRYLLFWFAPFCALPAALTLIAGAGALPKPAHMLLCAAILLGSWLSCRHMLPWMLHNAQQYSSHQHSYQQLQALKGEQPLVLTIDRREHYAKIWSQLLTFAAQSKRDGSKLFCLAADSWHLSFHSELQCAAQSEYKTPRVTVSAMPPGAGTTVILTLEGIHYTTTTPEPGARP